MKKIISILVCAAMIAAVCFALSACGDRENGGTAAAGTEAESEGTGGIVGGWTEAGSPEITDEFGKVFEKATDGLAGVEYVPVAYLGSQVVAGMNHRVLCKAAPVVPGAEATYAIVTVYEDPSGGAEITDISTSEASAEYPEGDGGFTETATPVLTDEAKAALTAACETLAGAEYAPVALLATRVAAGTNYRILCEAKATVPGAESEYVIIDVTSGADGGAGIAATYEFGAEENVRIDNPFVEYGADEGSLEAAREAVGFTVSIPDGIVPENYVVIDGAILEIDFADGYIRKALSEEDISGDWNEYENVKSVDESGRKVTLKGNGDKVMLAIWTDGVRSYCVGIPEGVSEDVMISYVNSVR